MLRRSGTLQNVWINRFSHRTMALLWGGGESIRNHFSLEKQNEALEMENFALRERLRQAEAVLESSREADASKEVALKEKKFVYIPATVVKISRNTAHNYVILNKGSEDGVKPYSGIVTPRGVVGIISAVDKHHSYGLTIMNFNISVSSRVGRSGIVSPLVWDGRRRNSAFLKDVPPHYEVAEGDTVYTSGFSSIFPPDIPVGVAGKTSLVDGMAAQTQVTLFEDFDALRYVTIVENPGRASVEELEKQNGI